MTALSLGTAPRFDLRVPVLYRGPGSRGTGVIWDISASGLRIEVASSAVEPGTQVRLKFSYSEGSDPVVAAAKVVRATDTGFAARFIHVTRALEEHLRSVLPRHTTIPKPR
jgi:hypothetical protein